MRRLIVLVVLVAASVLTPGGFGRVRPAAAAEPYCFPETKQCIGGAFRDFWESHGALEILGLPVTHPFVDDRKLVVQYFERAIFEWHPEAPPAYQVLLTRLGADQLGKRPEASAPPQPCAPPNCALLEQTQHTLRDTFLTYWQKNGGLPVFGFPLTEQFVEVNQADGKSYLVQYFERNRFELHPEYAGTRYEVLLGLLGAESLKAQPGLGDRPVAQVPEYTRNVGLPKRVLIPAIGVDAAVEPVGVDETNTMETPADPWNTGWFSPGARPGQIGNAVIAGHVDFAGIGPVVFWRLSSMTPGMEVWITADDGARWRFVVQSVETFPVEQFPGERVFGSTQGTYVNLISCWGQFDRASASYNQRIVVFARWDGVIPTAGR
ncbi:MAG: class F sortase [Thermomicrobiales bacterium]